jgi:predicted 3-demethylubiquinone-9 3-methyltransferase (glyoxalase superfamily)
MTGGHHALRAIAILDPSRSNAMTARFQRITPFLWFDNQAEQAAAFYTSVFDNSRITTVTRYSQESAQASGRPQGSVMTVEFELDGQTFTALNGGLIFKFNEALSLVVHCRSQDEVDHYWERLSADGDGQCGWLKDRFGVSWQVVPQQLIELLTGPDPEKVRRVTAALMQMKKIDVNALQQAAG